jgi:hypothetical protein
MVCCSARRGQEQRQERSAALLPLEKRPDALRLGANQGHPVQGQRVLGQDDRILAPQHDGVAKQRTVDRSASSCAGRNLMDRRGEQRTELHRPPLGCVSRRRRRNVQDLIARRQNGPGQSDGAGESLGMRGRRPAQPLPNRYVCSPPVSHGIPQKASLPGEAIALTRQDRRMVEPIVLTPQTTRSPTLEERHRVHASATTKAQSLQPGKFRSL